MKWITLTFLVFFISCNSFYGTHSHNYLDLTFDSAKINGTFLKWYVDSVLNKSTSFPDSIKSHFYISDVQRDINENDRLIHFKTSPEEWYLIGLEINPCWIEAIYNPNLNNEAFLAKTF